MSNNIFIPLNLTFNPLPETFSFPTITQGEPIDHYYFETSLLSDEYHAWEKSVGLKARSLLMFYTAAHVDNPFIHVDGLNLHEYVAINWVYGGRGSKMLWYDIKKEHEDKLLSNMHTKVGAPCILLEDRWCHAIAEHDMATPTLFKNGIPHKVDNSESDEARWCVSVRYTLTLEKAYEMIKQWENKNVV